MITICFNDKISTKLKRHRPSLESGRVSKSTMQREDARVSDLSLSVRRAKIVHPLHPKVQLIHARPPEQAPGHWVPTPQGKAAAGLWRVGSDTLGGCGGSGEASVELQHTRAIHGARARVCPTREEDHAGTPPRHSALHHRAVPEV